MELRERVAKSLNENFEYIFVDFKDFPEVTRKTRKQNAIRIFTGGVRVDKAMYRTDKENEQYIKRSLRRKLP